MAPPGNTDLPQVRHTAVSRASIDKSQERTLTTALACTICDLFPALAAAGKQAFPPPWIAGTVAAVNDERKRGSGGKRGPRVEPSPCGCWSWCDCRSGPGARRHRRCGAAAPARPGCRDIRYRLLDAAVEVLGRAPAELGLELAQ